MTLRFVERSRFTPCHQLSSTLAQLEYRKKRQKYTPEAKKHHRKGAGRVGWLTHKVLVYARHTIETSYSVARREAFAGRVTPVVPRKTKKCRAEAASEDPSRLPSQRGTVIGDAMPRPSWRARQNLSLVQANTSLVLKVSINK